jgi:hypothetical protein
LSRTLIAAADRVAVAVENDDMPGAEVIAIVPLVGVSGGRAEVLVVAGGSRGVVVVVAGGRASAGLVTAPGRRVALGELAGCAVLIGVIAGGEHRAGDAVQQVGGGLIT